MSLSMEEDKHREDNDRIIKVEIPSTVLTKFLNRAYEERKERELEDFGLVYVDLFYMPEGITVEGHGYSELRFLFKREKKDA